jgi:hypothetical protein
VSRARAVALALVTAAGCATTPRPASHAATSAASCDAVATLVSAEPALMDVEIHCRGKSFAGFSPSEDESAAHTHSVRDGQGHALALEGGSYRFRTPLNDAEIHYQVDLDAVADDAQSFDVAERSGRTLITAVSTWLFAPAPLYTGVPVRLRVRTPEGVQFATGLRQSGKGYALEAHEIPVSTYALFGDFSSSTTRVDGSTAHGTGQSEIELAIADGPLDLDRDVIRRWVADSARAVGRFWRGFPVPHTLLTLIPVPGKSSVVFGKVLPESAPGVVVLVGEHADRARLYDDWILVHELFHLGVPSFNGEGKWFDEGLATYFEPIIRARAGWRREEDVWAEFVRAMPLGLRAVNEKGLEQAEDFGEIYWGGAIVVLLADVEIRRTTAGKVGLEDGLRGVLDAGGQASEVWPLRRALALSDKSCGVSALEPLARAHAKRAEHVDLDALWRELGIERQHHGVSLRADAPLASVRHSIVFGSPKASSLARR